MGALDDFLALLGKVTTIGQQQEAAALLVRIDPARFGGGTAPGTVAFETAGRLLSLDAPTVRKYLALGFTAAPNRESVFLAPAAPSVSAKLSASPVADVVGNLEPATRKAVGFGLGGLLVLALGFLIWRLGR